MTFMLGQVDLSSYRTLTAPAVPPTAAPTGPATTAPAVAPTAAPTIALPLFLPPLPPLVPLSPYTESNVCDVYLAKQI